MLPRVPPANEVVLGEFEEVCGCSFVPFSLAGCSFGLRLAAAAGLFTGQTELSGGQVDGGGKARPAATLGMVRVFAECGENTAKVLTA